ncbi:MAG TPA: FAD-binding oxidoreductase [Pirellulales bacterium]|nr:FAD-binding oxidoreductase [Pirellulales bacterium]
MTDAQHALPLTSLVEPATQDEVIAHLRDGFAAATATYPIGGGTALDYGLPGREPGIGLRLSGLNRIVDYPDRDMTITVEAGITMAALAAELARHGQRLPVDAADAEQATLGGMIATNFSGPRRFGYGTLRDYVIGISAVDGRGTPFKAGGRVVKNVAGYDLCKLLTGSLGTLAVITQVTLKVRPVAQSTAFLACHLSSWPQAEAQLAALVSSRTTPVAIELSAGGGDGSPPAEAVATLLVGFEGNAAEVAWQLEQLELEWRESGLQPTSIERFSPERAITMWKELIDTPRDAPLVIKANVRPSAVTRFVQLVLELEPKARVRAHAGNGVIIAAFAEFSTADAGRILVQRLQPAAVAADGSAVVWSCAAGELTPQATWGATTGGIELMRAVKRQFDPKGLLNPGRFVYGIA